MSAKVTEAHREMARALWDEGGWAGPPPKAREWLALALADAEAAEREACCRSMCSYCAQKFPYAAGRLVHIEHDGDPNDTDQRMMECRAAAIRARGQS